MGGGDLNMKKSWHPGLIKNRAQVWEDQHAALQERKRIDALKKEIAEERAAADLRALNEAAGAPKRQERVEFLYAGPGTSTSVAADREAYLLGRKRIDDVLGKDSTGQEVGQVKKLESGGVNMRDVANKISMDPLLAIKKQEAAQYEALVRQKKAEKEAEARREARRNARRGDHRSRYRTQEKDDHCHLHGQSRRDRSESPDHRRHDRRDYDRPDPRRHDSRRERHYSRDSRERSETYRSHDRRIMSETAHVKDYDAERAAKLAAMTSAAGDLDATRDRRLQEARVRDETERTIEDAGRHREARLGHNSGFVRDMQLSAGLVR